MRTPANGGMRREPELPEHEEIVPEATEPRRTRNSTVDRRRARRLPSARRGICASRCAVSRARSRWILTTAWSCEATPCGPSMNVYLPTRDC